MPPTINDKALLASKGRIWVLDEAAAMKKYVELSVVDNVRISHPANPIEIKTPSGVTIFKSVDLGAQLSFDFYHPGDLTAVERLFRGAVVKTAVDGLTAIAAETVTIKFRAASEVMPLPGFNGAKTAATVNSIKSLDLVTTYTVTTDYTVAADAETGITLITQVVGGTIPLNTDVVVNYDYTPLKSTIVKPDPDGDLIDRFLVIDSYPDTADLTKYRRYFLPRFTATSDLVHQLLDLGADNQSPNILPVTMEFRNPDPATSQYQWYWIDTFNVV